MIAPLPPDESDRLDALRSFAVLDTPPESDFDDLTTLAATVCGAPVALVSLVDSCRQWFKSRHGVDVAETPRDVAFCAHAILGRGLFVVEDAAADPRFRDNPLVTGGPRIRFYAGMPLTTPDGYAVGTLCVIDRVPRTLTADQRDALRVLARQVTAQLVLRKRASQVRRLDAELRTEQGRFRAIFDATYQYIGLLDRAGVILEANRTSLQSAGVTADEVIGRPFWDTVWWRHNPRLQERLKDGIRRAAAGEFVRFVADHPLADGGLAVIDFSLSPIRDAAGAIVYLVPEGRDVTDRTRAEETFRVLFEQSSDAHLIFDERDGIIDCNHAAVTMLRCRDKSEVLALHPAVLSPEFQPCGRRSLDKCVDMDAAARARGFHRFDWTHRRADGEEFPCEVTLTPVSLHGRTVLLVVWHDLTDRKRAEDTLRASGERWQRQQNALLALTREDLGAADEAVGPGFLAVVARALRVDRVSVWYLAPDGAALRCVGLYESALGRHSSGATLAAAAYPRYFRALASEEVIAAADAAADPRTSEFRDGYLRPLGIAAMLDAPLRLAGRVRGVLCHEHVGAAREWTADEQVFALAAANILSLAAEQAERQRAEDALRRSEERFQAFMDNNPAVAFMKDDAGRYVYLNEPFVRRHGVRPGEWLGRTDFDVWPADTARQFRAHDDAVRAGAAAARLVETTPNADGTVTHWQVHKFPFVDAAGRRYLAGMALDMTAEMAAADALRQSEERFRRVVEGLAEGIVLLDRETRAVLRANRAFLDLLGYTADEAAALTQYDFVAHDRADVDAKMALVERTGRAGLGLRTYRRKGGEVIGVSVSGSFLTVDGRPVLCLVVEDRTEQMRAEAALRDSEAKFRCTLDRLAEGVFVVAVDSGAVVDANAAMLAMLGYTRAEFLALSPYDLTAGETPEVFARVTADAAAALAGHGRCDLGRRLFRRKDGTAVQVDVRVTAVRDGGGGLHAVVVRDVTEQVAYENRLLEYQSELEAANAKLKALAVTDGLTGVRNRAAFNDRLTEEYERAVRGGRPLSLLMMDVDHFKQFNDTFGHPAGDDVLRTVARTLVTTARITDFVARYGGEEFVVVLPDTDYAGAMVLAERCRRAVAAVPWRQRSVTVSVGVATLTADTLEPAALVQSADEALYRSKAAGRNRVHHGSTTVPAAALARAAPAVG